MSNNNLVPVLRTIIEKELVSLINNDFVLLELPYYSNIGDVLIWQGTEEYLSTLPYRCLYRCSQETYCPMDIDKDVIILLQGGGNFGDIWRDHHSFRLRIIKEYPNNPIIILPQTVYYDNLMSLYHESYIFSQHKKLTICVRDQYSYRLLNSFKASEDIRLVPDMAFYISDDTLNQYREQETNEILFLKRTDKELGKDTLPFYIDKESDVSIHDWPSFEKEDLSLAYLQKLFCEENCNEADNYAFSNFLPHMVEVGTRFISKYKTIYTTRLHVGILSVLLGKKVIFLDNSYGKNSNFYKTWLKGQPSIACEGQVLSPLSEYIWRMLCSLRILPAYYRIINGIVRRLR